MAKQERPAEVVTVADLSLPVFADVEQWVLEAWVSQGTTRTVRQGALLLREDEPCRSFFVLHKGSVRVFYRSPEGLEVVAKLFRAPAVFGEMECLSGRRYLESVEALEKTVVLEVPRAAFLEGVGASHSLAKNLLEDVAERLCIAAQNERSLAFNPVETRLANLFETYLDFYGLPVEGGTMIRIPLTQDDLANALGVARRSVTRALKRWGDEGLVFKRGRNFVISNLARLVANQDPRQTGVGYSSRRKA